MKQIDLDPLRERLEDGVIGNVWVTADEDGQQVSRRQTVPLSLDEVRAAAKGRVSAVLSMMITAGCPYEGKSIALDDRSRTDLGGMATTAVLSMSGAIPWPGSYALGWIAQDNERLPLPTPQDGVALAAAVAQRYAALVQHARDLKDAILAAGDIETVLGVDINAGWPVD